MTILKLCPFCNGEADIHESTEHDPNGNPNAYLSVMCDTCCAESQGFGYETTEDYGDPVSTKEYKECESNAIEAWNKRA